MNKKISFFGDILVDLVQDSGSFRPQPGGSIFNTAITTAKSGYDVNFISQIGDDYWGQYLTDFCRTANIQTENIYRSKQHKTSLAFAILDEQGNAHYDFYKTQSPHEFEPNILSGSRLFHFGSTFSLMPHNRDNIKRFLTFCRENDILISYDPNCRQGSDVQLMRQWCRMADIVKMSDEDMKYIYPDVPMVDGVMTILSNGAKVVVVTFGKYGAMAWTAESIGCAKCPPTDKPIRHTIGAGDNFTAGMIDYIIGNDIADLSSLDEEKLSQLCSAGNTAALRHLTNG